MDWKVQDDPWEEHARNFPNCGFVLLNKGREYVNIIRNNMKLNKKKLTKEANISLINFINLKTYLLFYYFIAICRYYGTSSRN